MKTIILFLIVSSFAFSQETENKKNIVYTELLGNGVYSSLNYERTLSSNITMRIGLGYVFSNSESNSGSHHDYGFLPLALLNFLIVRY